MLRRAEPQADEQAARAASASMRSSTRTSTASVSSADPHFLQRVAGTRAVGALLSRSRRMLSRLGTPLDQDLPADAEVPDYGEDKGDQRRYSKQQCEGMWEAGSVDRKR